MSNLMYEIGFLIIVLYLIFFSAYIEHKNARIEMCKEIGYTYLSSDKCIPTSEYNLRYNNTDKQILFKDVYEMK